MKWENESVETTKTVRTMNSGPILLSSTTSRYHGSGLWQQFIMSFGDHTIEDNALATWPTAAIARARVALDQFEAALMEDQVDG